MYIDQLWGDLASSIADNMIEAFLETGDAAANLEDVVAGVAKNMAKSMIMDKLMNDIFNDDLQNQLLGLLKSGDQTGANNLIKGAIDSAGELAPLFEGIMESVGLIAGVADDAASNTRTSASQGFAQASQDSIDNLTGVITNIENHTYGIHEMMRDNQARQQANTDAVLGHLATISGYTAELPIMKEDISTNLMWHRPSFVGLLSK